MPKIGPSRTDAPSAPPPALDAQIREHPVYKALSKADKKVADEILKQAKKKDDPAYYAEKLKLLLDTKEAPPSEQAQHNNDEADFSLLAAGLTFGDEPKPPTDLEEKITTSADRKWTTLKGDTATYLVDRRDPNDIVVKMKVHLSGKPEDVARTKSLEDLIEKHASTRGYTVDVELVDKPGKDVFEADAKPELGNANSGNWVGDAEGLAHEAHHRLGLDDRYDYIEAHAGNEDMSVSQRLHWFQVGMSQPRDPGGAESIMNDHFKKPLNDDICKVAKLDKGCMEKRNAALRPE